MQILLADDDPVTRTGLAGALLAMGHDVIVACDGAHALDLLMRTKGPQLAILDWKMPVLDGLEVVRRIRSIPDREPIYIIMLSSNSAAADVIEGLEAGADNYLTKPFSAGALRAHIRAGIRMVELENVLARRNAALQDALDHINTLRGIIPICAGCKKIRDDQGYWNQVEAYISKHTEAKFSHGLCPACAIRLYPELYPER